MAYIAPNSVVWILHDCPLDNTYEHTIYFAMSAGQEAYFHTLRKYALTEQTYTRVGRDRIRVQIPYDDLYDCNYLMFKNISYENKWFYAFITSIEYINNAVAEIQYEIDVMQTWMFDYDLRPCFVEREHAMSDAIGDNILPEPVALGEYVFNGSPVPLMADNFRNFVVVAIVDVTTASATPTSSTSGTGTTGTGTETGTETGTGNTAVDVVLDITGTIHANIYRSDVDGSGVERVGTGASSTELIDISGYDNFTVSHTVASAYNCFYDSDRHFISSFSCIAGDTNYGGDSPLTIPSNAAYVAVSNDVTDVFSVTTVRTVEPDPDPDPDPTPTPDPDPAPTPSTPAVDGNVYDGIYGAATLYAFRADDVSGINAKINEYVQKPDAVVSIYTCNSLVISPADVQTGGTKLEQSEGRTYTGYLGPALTAATTLDGHTCRNRKLLTYPYNFLHVDNVEGDTMEMRYEFCEGLRPEITTYSSITQPVEVVMHPRHYKNAGNVIDVTQGIRVSNFPLCSWAVDSYQAWIAQNSIPLAIRTGQSLVRAGAMGLIFSPLSTLAGALGAITDAASQAYTASIQADITKGTLTNGSSAFGHRLKNFYYVRMSITSQHAEVIDDFFDKFGYQTNRVKQPNISGRPYWNYVKTAGAIITGSVPTVDANKICSIYDHGITFWKSGNQIGNYSLNNQIQ